MACVLTFETDFFDSIEEPENPINPILGHAVGEWIRDKLSEATIRTTEIEAEDWGWYCDVELEGQKYMLGFTRNEDEGDGPSEVVVQIEKHRSLMQRLRGQNGMTTDDRLVSKVRSIIDDLVGADAVRMDHDA